MELDKVCWRYCDQHDIWHFAGAECPMCAFSIHATVCKNGKYIFGGDFRIAKHLHPLASIMAESAEKTSKGVALCLKHEICPRCTYQFTKKDKKYIDCVGGQSIYLKCPDCDYVGTKYLF